MDAAGIFGNFSRVATLNQPNYYGVQIVYDPSQGTLNVFDGTQASGTAKQLAFTDLIGQPTWLGNAMNFKTPMRSDLKVGNTITLPQGLNPINTAQSSLLSSSTTSFQGNYQISQVRHVGRYREASADAWVTVIDAVQMPKSASMM